LNSAVFAVFLTTKINQN